MNIANFLSKEFKRINKKTMWVGVGGTPGSGKSFTCQIISEFLKRDYSMRTKVISMDGYHYYRH